MNTIRGKFIVASGNIFNWEHRRRAGKGAISGEFTSKPSKADLKEAHAFCIGQSPPRARHVFEGVSDRKTANAFMDRHLVGGSRN